MPRAKKTHAKPAAETSEYHPGFSLRLVGMRDLGGLHLEYRGGADALQITGEWPREHYVGLRVEIQPHGHITLRGPKEPSPLKGPPRVAGVPVV